VLVKGDLEGFFLIITGSLLDAFLQNPLDNPIANKIVLRWFPSFGPMQFAVGGAFRLIALWGHLALRVAWTVAFTVTGLVIFRVKTRNRSYRATLSRLPLPTGSERV
jgi:ABC-2 type transport system permease protein